MNYYKVLLVDDESWVIESLKASIDWEAHGFEVAGTASSSQEALELLPELQPDVVFTDIRMPGMNGLELIKKGGVLLETASFIVISGYAEFAYAQKALTFGALAYCLKPFDEQEIAGVLAKVRKQKASSSKKEESFLVHVWDDPSSPNLDMLIQKMQNKGIVGSLEEGIGLFVCSVNEQAHMPMDKEVLEIKTGKSKYLCLAAWEQLEDRVSYYSKWLAEAIKGIGVSDKISDYNQLKYEIESVNRLADQYFIMGRAGIFRKQATQRDRFNELLALIDDAIRTGEVSIANMALDQAELVFRQDGLTVRHALQFYNMVLSFLYRIESDQMDNMLYSHEHLLETVEDLAMMIEHIRESLSRYVMKTPEYEEVGTSNETFKQIIQYVHQNYDKGLSIPVLSQKFFVNPSYISQLFKKELGETFSAYTTKLRINFACDLLENTQLMIGEIAEQVGYTDYFYFTRIFKRVTGKTPTQFRSQLK